MSERLCAECGAEVVGRSNKVYCSARCQHRGSSRRYHESPAGQAKDLARRRARLAADPDYNKRKNREWYLANKDRSRELGRKFAALHPNIHVLYIHGVHPDELHALYETQEGRCAICQQPGPERGAGCLHIDHDHTTGERRGLICNACNRALPLFEKFGGTWALRALAYLGDPPLPRLRKEREA